MQVPSLVQTPSLNKFLFGFLIGIISYLVIDLFLSILLTILNTLFFDWFTTNTNLLSSLSSLISPGIFVTILIVMQNKLKIKLITIGTASGFAGITLLLSILIPQVLK